MQCVEHEKEKESGTYTYFIKALHPGPDLATVGGYVSLPYEIRSGKVKITSLGSATQVRASLKMVEGVGVRYRVVSLMDAKFWPHSLISLWQKSSRGFSSRPILSAITMYQRK